MLKIKYTSQYNQPENVKNAIVELSTMVDARTRFVLKAPEEPPFHSPTGDDSLVLIKLNATSGKTTSIATDGTMTSGQVVRFGDGTSQKVTVTGWNYVLLVNSIQERDNYSTVKTCYIKDREVFAGLRQSVGLSAF